MHKLSFSQVWNYDNLFLAWQRVKENHGCAGVDGVSIEKFEARLKRNLLNIQTELQNRNYQPLPLLKFLVDKGNGEARPLAVPTVKDRITQSAVLELIEPIFEAEFEECSFAYRKGRSVKQAVYQIQEYRDKGYKWVVDADIDDYFNDINHELLLERVKELIEDEDVLRLIEMWVKAEVYDGESVFRLEKGIPQGSVISPILANLFLDSLDEELMGKGYKLVRYGDDFLILCKKEDEAVEAVEITDDILENLSLDLNEEKTAVVDFDQGFKYLGVLFVRSLIMVPFERKKKERRVLYMPPPLDIGAYLRSRGQGNRTRITRMKRINTDKKDQ
ncbi:group II intron reverse transcriptase/maturase [bacterium]|nr:group II intron reverse transcriptase/maturase [bacterium]